MDATPTTRASLLIRLRDPGDEGAWAEFVDIYRPLVHRLARRLGLQDADAEDLAQEVFVVVASAIERGLYDPARGSFRGWLFRISRNLTVNALVARGRHPRGIGDSEVDRLLADREAPSAEDSALFETEYRRRVLEWAAERVRLGFSRTAWRAFWATAVEGVPAPEVARELGMSVGSVYNAKSRAMAVLRREIARVEGEEDFHLEGG